MAKYSVASAGAGALSGAGTGAAIGSAIPGVGTAIGAGVGGLVGGVAGLFGSKKKKKKRLSTLDPEQQALRQSQIDALYGRGDFSNLYAFDPQKANTNFDLNYARPAYRNFQENIVPEITGQFRQGGLFNSSYTGQALSRAGRDVQEGLDAKRFDYLYQGEQAANTAKQNAINSLLGMQTFNYAAPQASATDEIFSQIAPSAAKYLFNKFGGTSPTSQPIQSTRLGLR